MPQKPSTTLNPFNNHLRSLNTQHPNTLFPACTNQNATQPITLPNTIINGNSYTGIRSKLCVP